MEIVHTQRRFQRIEGGKKKHKREDPFFDRTFLTRLRVESFVTPLPVKV